MSNYTLMRRPQVEQATGLKRSTIYLWMGQGRFPRPISLGARHVAWRSDEIEEWIANRPRVQRSELDNEIGKEATQ
jgi:prophage regulatory protein